MFCYKNSLLTLIICFLFLNACGESSTSSSVDVGSINADVETVAGTGVQGDEVGASEVAQFDEPDGVTVDVDGIVYMTDMGNNKIKQIDDDGKVILIAGTGDEGYRDGDAGEALFNKPDGIVTDSEGNIYIADTGNHVVRKITLAGQVTTVAGTGTSGDSEGSVSTAQLNSPTGITIDADDNIYVVDEGNNRIKKITINEEVVIVAGSGTAGYSDGAGIEAQFDKPHGLTIDSENNLYVTDQNNNRIRKINALGVVTTIAGDGVAGYENGNGTDTSINKPHGIAVNSDGEVFFADEDNNVIRKIDLEGEVTTYAGTGIAGDTDGKGDKARLKKPRGLALDLNEDLYVCDYGNNRVKKITKRANRK